MGKERIHIRRSERKRDSSPVPSTLNPTESFDPSPLLDINTSNYGFANISIETVQAKLEVSQPGDVLEQEADRVADRVIGMSEQDTPASSPGLFLAPHFGGTFQGRNRIGAHGR
jgi:hypothetical protein